MLPGTPAVPIRQVRANACRRHCNTNAWIVPIAGILRKTFSFEETGGLRLAFSSSQENALCEIASLVANRVGFLPSTEIFPIAPEASQRRHPQPTLSCLNQLFINVSKTSCRRGLTYDYFDFASICSIAYLIAAFSSSSDDSSATFCSSVLARFASGPISPRA